MTAAESFNISEIFADKATVDGSDSQAQRVDGRVGARVGPRCVEPKLLLASIFRTHEAHCDDEELAVLVAGVEVAEVPS